MITTAKKTEDIGNVPGGERSDVSARPMVDLLPPLTDEQLGRLVREVLALETPGSPVADLVKAVR